MKTFPTPANLSSVATRICLEVFTMGHTPSIKNSMYAIVDKKNREWKRRCVKGFVLQLISLFQTSGTATLTPEQAQSLIASLPPDDNWKVISELHVTCRKVKRGDEGAVITIEPI